jgi:hypothetical protein
MKEIAWIDVKIICEFKGLMAEAGVSLSGPVPPFPNACGCSENEVLGKGKDGRSESDLSALTGANAVMGGRLRRVLVAPSAVDWPRPNARR